MLPTGVNVKLLDWIKGAVTFTKAPPGPQTAQTPEPPPPPPPTDVAETAVAPPAPAAEQISEAELVIEPPEREHVGHETPVGLGPQATVIEPEHPLDVEAEPVIGLAPPIRIGVDAGGPPTHDEIERRRGLVRKFFNDYWSSIDDKPASFAERLDGAEGYINERVAAGGEPWQLDPATRRQLGLPPRKR